MNCDCILIKEISMKTLVNKTLCKDGHGRVNGFFFLGIGCISKSIRSTKGPYCQCSVHVEGSS